ncbi:MAG: hypothetical protein WC602_02845 [archaeon]
MLNLAIQKIEQKDGMTLIEVSIAIFLSMVVMIGGLQFFYGGDRYLNEERYRRLALLTATDRLENANRYAYLALSDSLTETNTSIMLSDKVGYRTTSVSAVDDPRDGVGGADTDGITEDYKNVAVSVSIPGKTTYSIRLSTVLTKYWNE